MTTIKKIFTAVITIVKAILLADFLKRLQLDKYFLHIVYAFALCLLLIWVSLSIERTMGKVEANQKTITELRYENSRLIFELAKVSSRGEVETNLRLLGSELKPATEPATVIK